MRPNHQNNLQSLDCSIIFLYTYTKTIVLLTIPNICNFDACPHLIVHPHPYHTDNSVFAQIVLF